MATGFSFGAAPPAAATSTAATGGFGGFGSTPAMAGFGGLGGAAAAPAAAPATGFSFGGLTSTTTSAAPATGSLFGATPAKIGTAAPLLGTLGAPAMGFGGLGGMPAATAATTLTGGLTLGTSAAGVGGFGLGGGVQPLAGLGGLGTLGAATGQPATGFNLGGVKPAAGLTLGGLGGAATGLGAATAPPPFLGGLGGIQTASVAAPSRGLGGTDPLTNLSSAGPGVADGKPSDAKTVKEGDMPEQITATVEEFKKHIKEQKCVREEISRMSSKPMYKVKEDVASLKQLLSLVSNALHRNTVIISKLKQESAQELKHAEIAHRTKDTPPGLQYENTAPNMYFSSLVEDFEMRMVMYRQQIEEMETHLAAMNQPSTLTPYELSMLLSKLQESFIHLAAQLQNTHEAVKVQKDHYLNYRKIFHSDTADIFERRRKAVEKVQSSRYAKSTGPTPFSGMSNAAAVAMAAALNRTQQPSQPAVGGPVMGMPGTMGGLTAGASAFGTAPAAPGFTVGGLGSAPAAATSLFGQTQTSSLFGQSTASTFGQPTTGFGLGAGATAFGQPAGTGGFGAIGQTSAFQLQKPPMGNKRGKAS